MVWEGDRRNSADTISIYMEFPVGKREDEKNR
jgi:hypothetical protein